MPTRLHCAVQALLAIFTAMKAADCDLCQLLTAPRVDFCISSVKNRLKLLRLRGKAEARGATFPPRLCDAVCRLDISLFDDNPDHSALLSCVPALAELDLRPGHAFLAVNCEKGFSNQVAARLLAPGGSNVGLSDMASIDCARRLDALLFRLSPGTDDDCVWPSFTTSQADVLERRAPFDRVLVHGRLRRDDVHQLRQRLAVGGRLLLGSAARKSLLVERVSEAKFRKRVVAVPKARSLLRGDFEFGQCSGIEARSPARLVSLALRRLATVVDPVGALSAVARERAMPVRHLTTRSAGNQLADARRLVEEMESMVRGGDSMLMEDFVWSNCISLTDAAADEVCRCPGKWMFSTTLGAQVLQTLVQFLNDAMGLEAALRDTVGIAQPRRQLICDAIRRLPLPPGPMRERTVFQEATLVAARLASDANALMNLLKAQQVGEQLVDRLRAFDNKVRRRLRRRKSVVRANCALFSHSDDKKFEDGHFDLLSRDSMPGIALYAILQSLLDRSCILRQIPRVHSCYRLAPRSGHIGDEQHLLVSEWTRLNAAIPAAMKSDADVVAFLAARFVDDAADLSRRLQRRAEEEVIADLASDERRFLRTVLDACLSGINKDVFLIGVNVAEVFRDPKSLRKVTWDLHENDDGDRPGRRSRNLPSEDIREIISASSWRTYARVGIRGLY